MAIFELNVNQKMIASFLDFEGNPFDAIGMLTELNLPEIMRKVESDARIGEAGDQERLLGFEPMSASMTLKGISAELDLMLKTKTVTSGGGTNSITVQITGVAEDRYSNTTSNIKYTLKGDVKRYGFHTTLTPNEIAEMELEMSVWGFGHELGTGNNFYFEPRAGKWEVNGVNLWA